MSEAMNPVTDDDLVLLYYGEHEDPSLAERVANDPELSARFDELGRTFAVLDRHTVPDPGRDFGARTWQRLVPRLAESDAPQRRRFLDWLLTPRLSLGSTAALLLVAAVSFWMGRQGEPALPGIDGNRLLEARVAAHLADADVLLTHLANNQGAGDREAEVAAALLVSNRIYRRAAATAERPALAALLAAVERPLTDIANAPELGTTIDASLLFKVRSQARRPPGTGPTINEFNEEVRHDRQL